MDKMTLRIFQKEVERQCKFALMAAQDLDPASKEGDTDRLWYSVQSFLVAAGNISKLLWPPKPLIAERASELRASLAVKDDSILEPRTFRNKFEHFDEHLEKWATSTERKNFADSNVGPTGQIQGLDRGDFLRNFDTTTSSVTFRGEEYQLVPIMGAIFELWEKAQIEANKPHWEL